MLQAHSGQMGWRNFVVVQQYEMEMANQKWAFNRPAGGIEIEEDLPTNESKVSKKTKAVSHDAQAWFLEDQKARASADIRIARRMHEAEVATTKIHRYDRYPVWVIAAMRCAQELYYFGRTTITGSYKSTKNLVETDRYPLWSPDDVANIMVVGMKEVRFARRNC